MEADARRGTGYTGDQGKTREGIFRVFYVTKFGDMVHVLHCFTKKTQKTEHKDIELGAKRYADARKDYEQRKLGGGER